MWASIDPSWLLGMAYRAPFVVGEARPRVPPADLMRVLRACGDDVRLRALRRIAERPRSTQELAPLVGITEAALSKHLRQLADAGVLESRRDGRYVLYHLRPDRLEPLSEGLLATSALEPVCAQIRSQGFAAGFCFAPDALGPPAPARATTSGSKDAAPSVPLASDARRRSRGSTFALAR
jgi:DNA-binding transcriptional ArsR family regulator